MTIIASEIDRFNRLSATWWNSAGPMRPLHVINELRLGYLRQLIAERFDCAGPSKLEGLRILDVGCGAGLLCEPLARSGAQVTGIDAAAKNVCAARSHATGQGMTIDYRVGDPAVALRPDERFDVVLLLEVVEHVADVEAFLTAAGRHVAPGGLLVASTIDRTSMTYPPSLHPSRSGRRTRDGHGSHRVRPSRQAGGSGPAGRRAWLSTRCHQGRREEISGSCARAQLRQLPTLPRQAGGGVGRVRCHGRQARQREGLVRRMGQERPIRMAPKGFS